MLYFSGRSLIAVLVPSLPTFGVSPATSGVKNVSLSVVSGKVETIVQGSGWSPAVLGMKLGSGDMIRTAKNSYAELSFNGIDQAAVVRVEENSVIKIDTYIASDKPSDRKILLDLAVGDVLVKANKVKNESHFQVRTPTSIVGVRGTLFRVRTSSEK